MQIVTVRLIVYTRPVRDIETSPERLKVTKIWVFASCNANVWNPDKATQFTIVLSHHRVWVDGAMTRRSDVDGAIVRWRFDAMVRRRYNDGAIEHYFITISHKTPDGTVPSEGPPPLGRILRQVKLYENYFIMGFLCPPPRKNLVIY